MAVTNIGDRSARAEIDREKDALENEGKEGQSIEEMAAAIGDDDDQAALFPLGAISGDPKVTLKNLVRAGIPTKLTCSLSKAEVGLTGGLIGLEESGDVLVTFEAGKVEIVPEVERDANTGKRKLKGVKLRQNLRAVWTSSEPVYNRVQVLEMLEVLGVKGQDAKIAELLGSE